MNFVPLLPHLPSPSCHTAWGWGLCSVGQEGLPIPKLDRNSQGQATALLSLIEQEGRIWSQIIFPPFFPASSKLLPSRIQPLLSCPYMAEPGHTTSSMVPLLPGSGGGNSWLFPRACAESPGYAPRAGKSSSALPRPLEAWGGTGRSTQHGS